MQERKQRASSQYKKKEDATIVQAGILAQLITLLGVKLES